MKYRPWGSIDWVLSLSSQKKWHFVGALGTEERSLCSWKYLNASKSLASYQMADIKAIDSDKYRDRVRISLDARRAEFVAAGGNLSQLLDLNLMTELFRIIEFAKIAERSGSSLILDVSSLPKRFFFPVLRFLVSSPSVKDLVLTYTLPAGYAPDNETLYEDIEVWRELPGFGSSTADEKWVVSVGFLVESLRNYLSSNPTERMRVLVPFPSSLTSTRRTWEAVANLQQDHEDHRFEKFRVDPIDVSIAFERICSIAGDPPIPLSFAPFGPKPTSVAMCLYAMQRGSSVYYPQPLIYNPDYSVGIHRNSPVDAINAYWIKHEGENFYAL
ncbi:MAG: hypothetical protein ACK42H_01590 [Planctomycetota bacterium]|jgi:hypothetical protein